MPNLVRVDNFFSVQLHTTLLDEPSCTRYLRFFLDNIRIIMPQSNQLIDSEKACMKKEVDILGFLNPLKSIGLRSDEENEIAQSIKKIDKQFPGAIAVDTSLKHALETYQRALNTQYKIVILLYDPNIFGENDEIPPEAERAFCHVGTKGGVVFLPKNSFADPEVSLAHEFGHIHQHIQALKNENGQFGNGGLLEIEKGADRIAVRLCGSEKVKK